MADAAQAMSAGAPPSVVDVLRQIEFSHLYNGERDSAFYGCAICGCSRANGHKRDCPVYLALALANATPPAEAREDVSGLAAGLKKEASELRRGLHPVTAMECLDSAVRLERAAAALTARDALIAECREFFDNWMCENQPCEHAMCEFGYDLLSRIDALGKETRE